MVTRPPINSAGEHERQRGFPLLDRRRRQTEAAVAVALRRRHYATASGPTSSTTADSVVLQKDFLGYTATATEPNIEAEVTRDSDGGMTICVPAILPGLTSAQIAAIASPVGGMIVYDTDTGIINYYDDAGGSWEELTVAP